MKFKSVSIFCTIHSLGNRGLLWRFLKHMLTIVSMSSSGLLDFMHIEYILRKVYLYYCPLLLFYTCQCGDRNHLRIFLLLISPVVLEFLL